MKILASFKITSSVLGLTALAGLTIPSAHADTMSVDSVGYLLTLIEVSSTAPLTYTYSNASNPTPFTVQNQFTDLWNVAADSSIVLDPFFEYFFAEGAGEPGELNNIVKGSVTSNAFTVHSDLIDLDDPIVITSDSIGTDNGVPIRVQFVDLASASEAATGVPDAGSSLSFLAMSLGGLVALSRFRKYQLT